MTNSLNRRAAKMMAMKRQATTTGYDDPSGIRTPGKRQKFRPATLIGRDRQIWLR
jgi:hypothetical protein